MTKRPEIPRYMRFESINSLQLNIAYVKLFGIQYLVIFDSFIEIKPRKREQLKRTSKEFGIGGPGMKSVEVKSLEWKCKLYLAFIEAFIQRREGWSTVHAL